jgi:hypothetical protein
LETHKAIVALGYRIAKDERRDPGSHGPEIG